MQKTELLKHSHSFPTPHISTSVKPITRGMTLLGSPVALPTDPSFEINQCLAMATKIAPLIGKMMLLNHAQLIFTPIRLCVVPKLTHLARTVLPDHFHAAAELSRNGINASVKALT